jgi:Cys-tRNA(Pro)/Cys-tRNA(Cys) deacylase
MTADRTDAPDTPATRWLSEHGIAHEIVETQPASSAEESAQFQGIELHQLLRTIVVRRGENDYVFVLVPGGRRFDWPKLRAHLGVNRLSLPDAEEAKQVTGYERGTITPFGSTNAWPVIADASIESLDKVAIGGGRRGVNIHLAPGALIAATDAAVVDVTTPEAFSAGAASTYG